MKARTSAYRISRKSLSNDKDRLVDTRPANFLKRLNDNGASSSIGRAPICDVGRCGFETRLAPQRRSEMNKREMIKEAHRLLDEVEFHLKLMINSIKEKIND